MGSLSPMTVNFIDVRRDKTQKSLVDMVISSLVPQDTASPSLPTLLLYDEKGLQLFEQITYLEEYYLTNAEIEVLTKHANSIAARLPAQTRLIELGSGNLRKVDILLNAFEEAKKPVDYFALDLSLLELQRTFAEIDTSRYHYVTLNALHGTYDDGLAWVSETARTDRSTCIMTMGSSIGNFSRSGAVSFLRSFKESLGPADYVLVGIDGCQDEERVFKAYNDKEGITEKFYRNGLDHVNRLLGYEAFEQNHWRIRTAYDSAEDKHQASYVALCDVETPHFKMKAGQEILLEDAYKYNPDQSDHLWHEAGLINQTSWSNDENDYYLHLLSPATIEFPDDPNLYASRPTPTVDDWRRLWAAWDTVTRSMVPRDELVNKPIQLRNALIFYLGHIPTFADIHYTRATGAKPIEPESFISIFERGIDPDVDNPELCHDHSEIPDTWPPLRQILEYSWRVRTRILEWAQTGSPSKQRKVARGLWLAYEHEAMHLETFLYMLLQSSKILPPPGHNAPDFETLAKKDQQAREESDWLKVPAANLEIGLNDLENDLPPDRYFGWDNERPIRQVKVKAFLTQSRCISNGEYAKFMEATKRTKCPAGWSVKTVRINQSSNQADFTDSTTGSAEYIAGKAVRTVFGAVPLNFALDWPVMASYEELEAYAKWAGTRIPSFEEARSIYEFAERQPKFKEQQIPSELISAVNGHLCNDGVEETPPDDLLPPKNATSEERPDADPKNVFIDLAGRNVGFKTWHPTAVTGQGDRLRGQCDNGGLWEWTSTPLSSFEGFKAMELYPGYTADFFDGKHNIILGGSWATAPRIAGRRSFVNWYQRNYPFTWATARLVQDLE